MLGFLKGLCSPPQGKDPTWSGLPASWQMPAARVVRHCWKELAPGVHALSPSAPCHALSELSVSPSGGRWLRGRTGLPQPGGCTHMLGRSGGTPGQTHR